MVDLAGTPESGEHGAEVRAAGGRAITMVPETAASHGLPLVRVRRTGAQVSTLLAQLAAGEITLPVQVLPLAEIAEAHRALDARHTLGKIVLDLTDNPHLATGKAL